MNTKDESIGEMMIRIDAAESAYRLGEDRRRWIGLGCCGKFFHATLGQPGCIGTIVGRPKPTPLEAVQDVAMQFATYLKPLTDDGSRLALRILSGEEG